MKIFEKQHCGCGKKECYYCWLKGRVYNATVDIIPQKEMDINDILKTVSIMSGITTKQIAGQSRKENILIARQMFCYIARRKERFPGEPVWTLKQIGEAVNYKQHGSVIHSVETVDTMLRQTHMSEYKSLGRKLGLV